MASVRKRKWVHNGVQREAWVVAYTDQDGKRRIKTFDKKKDADAFRQKVEAEIKQGVHTASRASVRVADAVREFMLHYERMHHLGELAGNTVLNYRATLERQFQTVFGNCIVSDLTSGMIQKWIDGLRVKGRKPNSIATYYGHVFALLDFAVLQKWTQRNVLKDLPCRLPKKTKRASIPSKADIQKLVEHAEVCRPNQRLHSSVMLGAIINLGIFAGLRPGEVNGLQWEDIDRAAGVIGVRHSQSAADGLKTPKSDAGQRVVPLSPPVLRALDRVERFHAIRSWAYGPGHRSYDSASKAERLRQLWSDPNAPSKVPNLTGHVILTVFDRPAGPDAMWQTWADMMANAGLGLASRSSRATRFDMPRQAFGLKRGCRL